MRALVFMHACMLFHFAIFLHPICCKMYKRGGEGVARHGLINRRLVGAILLFPHWFQFVHENFPDTNPWKL